MRTKVPMTDEQTISARETLALLKPAVSAWLHEAEVTFTPSQEERFDEVMRNLARGFALTRSFPTTEVSLLSFMLGMDAKEVREDLNEVVGREDLRGSGSAWLRVQQEWLVAAKTISTLAKMSDEFATAVREASNEAKALVGALNAEEASAEFKRLRS
jgi:hypothetical protein